MRQDAIRRVQEMQRRARTNINNTNRVINQTTNERPETSAVQAEGSEAMVGTDIVQNLAHSQQEAGISAVPQSATQAAPQAEAPQIIVPQPATQIIVSQPTVTQIAAGPIEIPLQPHTYTDEVIYHNPIAPSYLDNDEVIEPVVDTNYTNAADAGAETYQDQPDIYPPSYGDAVNMQQGYGAHPNMQQGMGNNRNGRSNQGNTVSGNHSTLGGLLNSLLGTGNRSSSGNFSADTIMDTVAGLKSNFGETISNTLSSVTSPVTQIMDAFGIDSDKLIIIALILILLNEKSDKTLLIALGYLLIF